MYCPKCGTENENGVTFCGNCGSSLSKVAPVENQETGRNEKVCGKCGVTLAATATFCKRCGAPTSDQVPLPSPLSPPPGSPKNYLPFVVLGALLIAVAVSLGIFFMTRSGDDDSNQQVDIATAENTRSNSQTQTTRTASRTTTSSNSSATTSSTVPPGGSTTATRPTVDEMKNDLLGERLSSDTGGSGLEFEALREFQSFDIYNTAENGSTLEYNVSIRLRDYETNANYSANVMIVYKESGSRYQFVSVTGDYYKI